MKPGRQAAGVGGGEKWQVAATTAPSRAPNRLAAVASYAGSP